jgi:hypothetical protein
MMKKKIFLGLSLEFFSNFLSFDMVVQIIHGLFVQQLVQIIHGYFVPHSRNVVQIVTFLS